MSKEQRPLRFGIGSPEEFVTNLLNHPLVWDMVLEEFCRLWLEDRVPMDPQILDMVTARFRELAAFARTGKRVSRKQEAKWKMRLLIEVFHMDPEVARTMVAKSVKLSRDTVRRYALDGSQKAKPRRK